MGSKAKHISPAGEDHFEEAIEGTPENFGSIDDWETEAVLKMRKLMKGQTKSSGGEREDIDADDGRSLSTASWHCTSVL